MGAMIGLTTGLATKPVWFKYRANQFYPAWVHSFATALVQVPIQVRVVGWAAAMGVLSISLVKGVSVWFKHRGIQFYLAWVHRCPSR